MQVFIFLTKLIPKIRLRFLRLQHKQLQTKANWCLLQVLGIPVENIYEKLEMDPMMRSEYYLIFSP